MASKLHLIEEFLECSVCQGSFVNPRVLSCLHSFCKDCLNKHIEPMTGRIACPKCDFKTVLGKDGLVDLKVNSLILNLQNFNKIHNLIKNPTEPIVCTLCDSREKATGRCFECDEFLCLKCVESHQRIKMFHEHVVSSLDELKTTSLRSLYKKSRKVSKCSRHEDENQRYFCQSCDVTICRECTVVDHPRPAHDYVDVRDAASKCRNEVTDKMNDLKKKKGCFQEALDNIQSIENNISQKASKMRLEVVCSSDEKIKLIKQEEKKLLSRIETQIEKKFGKIINKKCLIESKFKNLQTNVDFLNEILNLGSDRDVISIRTEIESTALRLLGECKVDDNLRLPKDIEVLNSEKPKPAPRPRLEKKGSSLKRGGSSRGESFFTTPLSCIAKFGKQGTGLKEFGYVRRASVTRDGDIAITDTNNCKIQVYTVNGELKLTINVAKEPLNVKQGPLDVAITPDGRILIVQEECTYMTSYNMKGDFLNKLAFVAENESTGPCLAVSHDGRVAIGNWQNDTLRLYYADGSLIWKITCPSPWSIAINSKNQIAIAFNVSLHTRSKVKLINEKGEDIHEVAVPSTNTAVDSDMDLTGICFDTHDNLYILDWTMKGVHMLNMAADGTYQYVMCVVSGLEYPLGITCTQENKLIVVEKHFVSVFNRTTEK